ncbi:protein adenylyltransferase SelO [Inhella gelatinilytica]|uniref:Protein nucleotidyltransferase YdiU n=1 Tax=Inhella gelatinilytica TaxID=2795030 RepID=A0A931IXF3_9BURK|nr:YdiU family protein [Inhella gelatinilytica]MBH9551783.1 YdiU family protein [Inhella gelatinilytica]
MLLDNRFARDLPTLCVPCNPVAAPAPQLVFFNTALAADLGLPLPQDPAAGAALWSGNALPPGITPVAQAYSGHQFGHFSPVLGDGRALLLGERQDHDGQRRDLAFKGSGRTPFSRRGDGLAALGPMLREVLIGEGLHALGIPATRALAVATTGAPVYRDAELPGAVLTRVAASHLRVGSFQYAAAHTDRPTLQALLEHTLARHDPQQLGRADAGLHLLAAVAERQARLIAQWMGVGFVHGVMNTDNMALSGESIDFGPCAFLDAYDPARVFSSIDTHGRYAFGNQPAIAQWNLARLAEALLPLWDEAEHERVAEAATTVLQDFATRFEAHWQALQARKLGLSTPDAGLAHDWLALLHEHGVDHTAAWRALADARDQQARRLLDLFPDPADVAPWLARWQAVCAAGPTELRAVNPRVIPRNHRVEEALMAASEAGDWAPFNALLVAVRRPFDDDPALARFAEPPPAAQAARYRTFCGT